jgi:glyoxylase-like metal-dependent hydrolase (beta-lactamase superfamily II)/DNA-binding phage protein
MAYVLEDEFGDIVQKARIGRGLTISQLARITGISQDQLSKMEEYTLKPTEEQVRRIADALKLSFPKLLDIAMERWAPAKWDVNFDSAVEVVPLSMPVGGGYSAWCYLAVCRRTGATAVVDTGVNSDGIIAALDERNLKSDCILITHGHSDHTGGLRKLQMATQARVYVCRMESIPTGVECIRLDDSDTIKLGELDIRMLHTPGHTAGSCCYHVGKAVFVGDTIFAGSVGRANYSYEDLLESIRNKLFSLDDDVHIFPGHGPVTTVGGEKEHNPFF